MAKSLKSKSKRTFRRIKREDPKSVFHASDNLRMARLSSNLKASALKPKALTDAEEHRRAEDGYVTEEEDEEEVAAAALAAEEAAKAMIVDGEEKPKEKVSTSGPRLSRRESYRADKRFMIRLPRKTEFRSQGERKIMSGKPHRRR